MQIIIIFQISNFKHKNIKQNPYMDGIKMKLKEKRQWKMTRVKLTFFRRGEKTCMLIELLLIP